VAKGNAKRISTTAAILVVVSLAPAACFDWNVRGGPAPADAAPEDARPPEGDAASADASDATPEPDGAPDCAAIEAELVTLRAAARSCQLAQGHCATKAKDECDCDLFVAVAGSAEASAYTARAREARALGCTSRCGASCAVLPVQGGCVQQGGAFTCSP
jgi:hypothetical protein